MKVILVGNFFDDQTRIQRKITTDSPAASRKSLQLAKALNSGGYDCIIYSMGRGRRNRSAKLYKNLSTCVDGIPVHYASYLGFFGVTYIFTAFSLLFLDLKFRRACAGATYVFYNRNYMYLLLLVSVFLRRRHTILELEDGFSGGNRLQSISNKLLRNVFDHFITRGALLAASSLATQTNVRPTACFYGSVEPVRTSKHWTEVPLNILYSGTICDDTGLRIFERFCEALEGLSEGPNIFVHICGRVLEPQRVNMLNERYDFVMYHGRLGQEDYTCLLEQCHLGLSLRDPNGGQAWTTFPSRAVEYAEYGLLVVATAVGDIQKVLGPNSIYIDGLDHLSLVKALLEVDRDRDLSKARALLTQNHVMQQCSSLSAVKAFNIIYENTPS